MKKHLSKQEERLVNTMRRKRSLLNYEEIYAKLTSKRPELTAWEASFLESLDRFAKWSGKQKKVIETLYAKYLEGGQK